MPVQLEGLEDLPAETPAASTRAVGAYSAESVSRTKDFAEFTDAELERARALLRSCPGVWACGARDAGTGRPRAPIDLRPLLAPEPDARRRAPRSAAPRRRDGPRPIVVIGDVSGSMERYSRLLLHFVYGLAHSGARVESFVFATRLDARDTRRLARPRGTRSRSAHMIRRRPGLGRRHAHRRGAAHVQHRWARRVMRHGPVVLIVSDGWDRGDPALLARSWRGVRRSCRRLIWLNPLLGSAQLRAADARHAGGAAARRRFPAGAQPRQPRAARRSPAHVVEQRPAPTRD